MEAFEPKDCTKLLAACYVKYKEKITGFMLDVYDLLPPSLR
jgi:hypothetical protein